jgi:hypothetical protein
MMVTTHYDDDLPISKKQRGWSLSFFVCPVGTVGKRGEHSTKSYAMFGWQLYPAACV